MFTTLPEKGAGGSSKCRGERTDRQMEGGREERTEGHSVCVLVQGGNQCDGITANNVDEFYISANHISYISTFK